MNFKDCCDEMILAILAIKPVIDAMTPYAKIHDVEMDAEKGWFTSMEIETIYDPMKKYEFCDMQEFIIVIHEILLQAKKYYLDQMAHALESDTCEYYRFKHMRCEQLLRDTYKRGE